MLDESGSMDSPDGSSGRSIWENTLIAAKQFANELAASSFENSLKITILTYDDEAHLEGE